ncbi:TetR/AcrR family transcriptional regulator [Cecembia rubra]|uniref:TetR/AcrR family transcriptional regulator n=1 Tax=Cecembia rubra TaxID=1485585 RepID=UPI002714B1E4|nr:TetR/AcrR family transcriptional regulator [Cecembia rubra]
MSKKAEIESRILETAYRLFLVQGYRKTTMDDIAQELSMSKKTLYKYYPGKMELLAATFDILKNKLSIKVESLVDNKYISYPAKLKSMLTILATDLAPINSELLEDLREHTPEIWKEIQEYIRQSAYLRFQKLIQEGVDKGFVSSQVNVSLVVLMYASAIQNLIDPRFLSQFPDEMSQKLGLSTAEIYDQIIQVIYQGILTDESKDEFRKV